MSLMVIVTQVLLPLALLAWITFYPAAGWLAWGLQLISVATVLLGIGLASLWAMPPFWVPYAYGFLLLLIVATHLLRKGIPGTGFWRASAANSVVILMVAMLGMLGGYLAWHAAKGRMLPEEAVVNIAAPFPPGHYLIAHGGSTPMINVHLKTLDPTVERFRPWRGQSKALDIFRITPMGLHKEGWQPTDPARYTTFGVPVLSPCSGEVALLVYGIEDMSVPEMDHDHMAGNYVAINCGGFFVILAHLRQGSIAVAAGDKVKAGDILGQMGNSGNSSEPHLHVHAQRGLPEYAPLAGEPLWLTIDNRFMVRNDTIYIVP
ncbi:M23 family metallopeptidase [Marinobacter sp. F4206]|uniref:M23 family metallopeptidase n=1 Tax=Marinobacter sp. F4206 TaxID=2861777 RepID=UPI001C5FCC0B|nr:M23 family metallopeptidase [Marinobacter sp. F4206]MBW4933162.1 M23 family metallopeptidase [Marinobacter sp. F4206]